MAKRVGKPLTAKTVAALSEPGMYCDGNNLYLKVSGQNAKSWIFRAMVQGRRRDYGLGSADLVSLKEARDIALDMRRIARKGEDPKPHENSTELTFSDAAKRAFNAQKVKWSSGKHEAGWWATLEHHVLPSLGGKPLSKISTKDVYELLEPIYQTKPPTAKRVRQRIGIVFDWAKAAGYYRKENPVSGLNAAFPSPRTVTSHHDAMHWKELPDFMAELHKREGLSARLTEFTILTCLRSGEARSMQWEFIQGNTIILPAQLMKTRNRHRVPLSRQCRKVLELVPRGNFHLVFPSSLDRITGEPKVLSTNVYKALYKRMRVGGFTTHGFRSTFKDWCTETGAGDWDVSEAALAHVSGNSVERAYARSDLLDKRRELMQQWADYAMQKVWRRPARVKLEKHRKSNTDRSRL